MIFIIKEYSMNCWSKKLFKQFKTYYGNSINECEKDFNGGDLKKIIISLTMKLVIPPEEFLDLLLISSARIGVDCFKEHKEVRLELYNKCVFTANKYKIDLPEEVELLIKEDKPKVSLFNKIKSIFKK